ncbi:MAG: replication-associated recombination protein A [Desulfuromonadia bacterium]
MNDMDLFTPPAPDSHPLPPPLAERMRPTTLEEYVGQSHLLGPGKPLRVLIEQDAVPSLILWGPPGSGKTTLARVIAARTKARFVFFSAILSGVKEIRDIVRDSRDHRRLGIRTILFVDEIHRFSRSQQDAFLPHLEDGTFTLIGATTENPSFEIISPLLSRSTVLLLHPLSTEEIVTILRRALEDPVRGVGQGRVTVDPESLDLIARSAQGDARIALSTLETASILATGRSITPNIVAAALQQRRTRHDKVGDQHYDVVSAFIKSMRGSDPDASLYWLARMIDGGEDPLFILRRMMILASEDIGNADPRALQVAVAAFEAFRAVGMPEGRIVIAQAVAYLATAPKSNASYRGIDAALAAVRKTGTLPVPIHLRNAPTDLMKQLGYGREYRYPHDFSRHYVEQQYLPDELTGTRFYEPAESGYERTIRERMEWLGQSPKKE